MSHNELEKLYKLSNLQAATNDDADLLDFLKTQIYNQSFEMCIPDPPDIKLSNKIGLEHTEVSFFKETEKYGDKYKFGRKYIFGKKYSINIYNYVQIESVDIKRFFDYLDYNHSTYFEENIINAIEVKHKKMLKSVKDFKTVGLWIETPEFIHLEGINNFLLYDKFKNALSNSIFNFYILGNNHQCVLIKKESIKNNFSNSELKYNFISEIGFSTLRILNDCRLFQPTEINTGIYELEKNINYIYLNKRQIQTDELHPQEEIKLFIEDIEAKISSYKISENQIILEYEIENIKVNEVFNLQMDIIVSSETNMIIPVKKNETIDVVKPAQINDSSTQRVLTGTLRIVIRKNNIISIYTYISKLNTHSANFIPE